MGVDSEKGRYTSPEGSATWEYVATMSCSLLIFSLGCLCGWSSPTTSILMGPDSPIPLTSSHASTLVAISTMGHSLAPMLTVVMANKLGRKNSLLVAGIPSIICWGLIALTKNIIVLFAARFISGFSIGLLLILPPMYLGEIASAKLRGAVGMVCGTMINAGVLFMFVTAPYLSVHTMAYVCWFISILAVISVWFIPDSPYFLAMVGKFEEAEGALEKLRGKTDVAEELDLIKMTIKQRGKTQNCKSAGDEKAPEKFSTWKQLFTVVGNRRALYINLLFLVVLQFGSYISIIMYGQIIIEKMDTGIPAHICTMISATLQLVSNILTAFIIDKLGRRPLIGISGYTSGACSLVIGVYFYLMEYTETDVTAYGLFALCAVFANIVLLNFGLMPVQMVVHSEILGTDVKELVTCLIGVCGGLMGTIGAKAYLTLAETWKLGHSVPFLGFPIVTWIGTTLILKFLPETKGRTLFEIQKDLNA